MFARLGRFCFCRRRLVLGLWLGSIVAIFGVSGAIGPAFDGTFTIPASESRDGFDALDRHFGGFGSGQTGSVVFEAPQGVDDPAVQSAMSRLFSEIGERDEVTVLSPYEGFAAQGQVNAERTIAFATINLDATLDQTATGEIGSEIRSLLPTLDGVQIEVGGAALAEFEPPESELIGIAFAIVVLIVAFGSVLAMGLPIGVAVAGVATGAAVITLLTHVVAIPDFAVSVGAMIGLGVGIDYALFIVTRYREGVAAGLSSEDATVLALDTAGRAVIFAGITVVVSLLGMLLMGLAFVSGMGIAASATVLVTMIASVTLLPAFLGFAQHRVEITRWRGLLAAGLVAIGVLAIGLGFSVGIALAPIMAAVAVLVAGFFLAPLRAEVPRPAVKPMEETFAYRWSRLVQANPWPAAAAGAGILLVISAPVLGLRLGFSDEGNQPESTTTRRAYDLLAEGFGPGFNGPLLLSAVPEVPTDVAVIDGLVTDLEATSGIARVSPPFPSDVENPERSAAFIIQVVPSSAPQAAETTELVDHLRAVVVPTAVEGSSLDVNVTGPVAASVDFTSYMAGRVVVFFTAVLVLSFFLLMVVFRSLMVPLKAVIMNMLSISAAYGVVVAIFQWGWAGSVFGVEPAPIEPFLPMMMFAIVFGLSMDYEVFLLSRVKEDFDRTGDPVNSVANGLAQTARVITAAAAIMVVVFGSFLFEDDRIIKTFGMGLATAVFLDATLVRMLLVPATMELLGARNWWLPLWLDRLLPRVDVEGAGSFEAPSPAGDH